MEGQGVTMGKWRLKGKGKETREEGRRHCLPYSQLEFCLIPGLHLGVSCMVIPGAVLFTFGCFNTCLSVMVPQNRTHSLTSSSPMAGLLKSHTVLFGNIK